MNAIIEETTLSTIGLVSPIVTVFIAVTCPACSTKNTHSLPRCAFTVTDGTVVLNPDKLRGRMCHTCNTDYQLIEATLENQK